MTTSIEIKRVQSKKELEDFIEVPFQIYKDDPHWVPPLRMIMRDLLNVKKNPFFKHAYIYPLVAYQNGRPVARIAGIVDENHNKYHKDRVGFFGFFECPDNPVLAKELFSKVQVWLKEWGMGAMRGPMNPTVNHECGLLIEGFNSDPFVMMPHNLPYYSKLIEQAGFKKCKDMYAFNIYHNNEFAPKLIAQAERLKKRADVKFRCINMKKLYEEIFLLVEIFNDAWSTNWGFVPMEKDEIIKFAKELKDIVDPRLIFFAEVKGEAVGFGLAIPDINIAFKKIKDGKLFPFGLPKLLWYLKGPGKKAIKRCRIPILGVRKKFQPMGIGSLLFLEYLKQAPGYGYPTGEASWILEDNISMIKAAEKMVGEKTKTYRVYEQSLQ